MSMKKLVRQVSDRVQDFETAQDGIAGILAHDFCVHAYIIPDDNKEGSGWRVVSLNDLGQDITQDSLSTLQTIVYVDDSVSPSVVRDNRRVEVRVVLVADKSDLDEDDLDLPDVVAIEVYGDLEDKWVANAALDVFHEENAVACLENYDFQVWMNGVQLHPDCSDSAPDNYSLIHKARVL